MAKKQYKFDELMNRDMKSLKRIKKTKQEELYHRNQEKLTLAQNILSLQELIKNV